MLPGSAGRSVGVEHYAFADYQTRYRQFGITAGAVAAARDSIHDAEHGTRPGATRHLRPEHRRHRRPLRHDR